MAESQRDEIAKLESMYQANPEGRVFTHLAEAYRKAGDLARAREVLEEGLRRHADSASGFVVLGRVMQDMGQPQESSAAFARVLELDPENRVALRTLGDLARAEGHGEEALTRYRQLQALDPADEAVAGLIAEVTAEPASNFGVGTGLEAIDFEPSSAASPTPYEDGPTPEAVFPHMTPVELAETGVTSELGLASETGLPPIDLGGLELEPPTSVEPGAAEVPQSAPGLESFDMSAFTALAAEAETGAEPPAAPLMGEGWSELLVTEGEPQPAGDAGAESSVTPFPSLEGLETLAGETMPGAMPEGEPAPLRAFDLSERDVPPPYPPIDQVWGLEPAPDAAAEAPPPSPELVTETMADLYRSQGHLLQAAEIYRTLLRDRRGDQQLERKLLEVELAILSPASEAATPAEAPSGLATDWGEIAPEAPEPALMGEPEAPLTDAGLPQPAAAAEAEAPLPVEPFVPELEVEAAPVAESPVPAVAEVVAEAESPVPAVAEVVAEAESPVPPVAEAVAEAEPPAEAAAPAPEPAWMDGEPAPVAEAAVMVEGTPVAEATSSPTAAVPETPAVPAMEAVWGGAAAMAAGADSPYAWESGAADEEQGPPVATYLRSLLSWRRSGGELAAADVGGVPEPAEPPAPEAASAEWEPEESPAPEAPSAAGEPESAPAPAWEPEVTWESQAPPAPTAEPESPAPEPWEPEAAAPAAESWQQETAPAAEPWQPEAAAAPEWAEPQAPPAPEPTWADEAAGEPWQQPTEAAGEPAASGDDMAWLLGPEGAGAEPAPRDESTRAGSGAEAPASPGDDDDLEMFRAWLQSLKK